MTPRIIGLLLLASPPLLLVRAQKSGAPTTTSSSGNARLLQFSSPLQSYTVFDRSALSSSDRASPRRKFLPRFRAGLAAEKRAKEVALEEQRRGMFDADDEDEEDESIRSDGGWAEASAAADERRRKAVERRAEAAHDAAVKGHDERVSARALRASSVAKAAATPGGGGKYQFVGVVHDGKSSEKSGGDVTWYARKKSRNAKWNVRLVHVNRDAVLRDLFVKGKVDVYGRYVNEGIDEAAFSAADADGDAEGDRAGMKPRIRARYAVRERSWKNLWNFSPRRMFAAPSGSFWRERRIGPGLYTDGTTVYESVYRYRDGKNGMKPVATLSSFLASPGVGYEEKMRVVERLKGGEGPDVVVEK